MYSNWFSLIQPYLQAHTRVLQASSHPKKKKMWCYDTNCTPHSYLYFPHLDSQEQHAWPHFNQQYLKLEPKKISEIFKSFIN